MLVFLHLAIKKKIEIIEIIIKNQIGRQTTFLDI